MSVFRHLLRAKWSDPELRSRPAVLAWVAAAHFTHATAALSRTFNSPEFVNVRFPVTLATDEIVAGLNDAQPDVLLAYPSALHVLSVEARAGRLRIAPPQILSCSEPLLPEIRSAAEAAWDVRVGNAWGTSEGGGVAIPCAHAQSHLSDDLVIVEPVDEAGQTVAPGERSAKIFLTNLFNQALPLIRYEITDEVMMLAEPCPCGSAHRCVADIHGRLDDVFVYDGRRVRRAGEAQTLRAAHRRACADDDGLTTQGPTRREAKPDAVAHAYTAVRQRMSHQANSPVGDR